jgi:hypothetical protein
MNLRFYLYLAWTLLYGALYLGVGTCCTIILFNACIQKKARVLFYDFMGLKDP